MATIELYKEIEKAVSNSISSYPRIVWLIDIALEHCQNDEVKAYLLLAKARQYRLERPEK